MEAGEPERARKERKYVQRRRSSLCTVLLVTHEALAAGAGKMVPGTKAFPLWV